jgi:ribonuclease-3
VRKRLTDILAPYGVREDLLRQALTHRSVEDSIPDNERLEFLGDAVLQLVVSEMLYERFPRETEGDLTKRRALTVSEPTLTAVARSIGLGRHLRMSRGEEMTGGRERSSILSDAMEAVVAAVYLSGGLDAARGFVDDLLGDMMGRLRERDFKSVFQQWAQEHRHLTPTYRIVVETGPDHSKMFGAECLLGGETVGAGEGRTKKDAEQAAARDALGNLGVDPDYVRVEQENSVT